MEGKVKLLMSWDIPPDQEAKTLEFMANELAPAIRELGITPTEAWYTVYGDKPQILVGGVTDDLATMHEILGSQGWSDLLDRLGELVSNYEQKLVRARGRLQL
jgi:hypothetical protein